MNWARKDDLSQRLRSETEKDFIFELNKEPLYKSIYSNTKEKLAMAVTVKIRDKYQVTIPE